MDNGLETQLGIKSPKKGDVILNLPVLAGTFASYSRSKIFDFVAIFLRFSLFSHLFGFCVMCFLMFNGLAIRFSASPPHYEGFPQKFKMVYSPLILRGSLVHREFASSLVIQVRQLASKMFVGIIVMFSLSTYAVTLPVLSKFNRTKIL